MLKYSGMKGLTVCNFSDMTQKKNKNIFLEEKIVTYYLSVCSSIYIKHSTIFASYIYVYM